MSRLRDDRGFSVIELAVAFAATAVLMIGLGGSLVAALRTGNFGSRQSESLDSARLVLNQVARDLQGSKGFADCSNAEGTGAGTCVMLTVQPPTGPDQRVRFRLVGPTLYREVAAIDDVTGTYPDSRVMTERLANTTDAPATALFTCMANGGLLQISLNLRVQPDPANSPTFDLQTMVRPRNIYRPDCPTPAP